MKIALPLIVIILFLTIAGAIAGFIIACIRGNDVARVIAGIGAFFAFVAFICYQESKPVKKIPPGMMIQRYDRHGRKLCGRKAK